MDWKTLATTFGVVFLAELGDKTQLATLALSTGGRSRLAVFVGASAALVTTVALAVVGGGAISRIVPPVWLNRASGVLMLVLGALLIARAR